MSKLSNPIAMMLLTTAIAFGITACNDDNATTENTTTSDVSEPMDQAIPATDQDAMDQTTMDSSQGTADQTAPEVDQDMMEEAPEMSQGVIEQTAPETDQAAGNMDEEK